MNAAPVKVLVIDDEPPIRKLLRMGLSTQGYEILEAPSGKVALELLAANPALIILDLGLPDIQGHELLRMIRGRNDAVPIVVLSSRGDEAGKVQALDLGADDYLTKPFGMDELLARMRAALRHQLQVHGERPVFRSGELSVDLVRRLVKVGSRDVKLSPKEYELLRVLVQHAGKVLTHRFLLKELWDELTDAQYLRVYVRQLRQKIETDPEAASLRPDRNRNRLSAARRRLAVSESGTFADCVDCFSPPENDHGTKIFKEGIDRRRTRDEEAQGRDVEERPIRQKGDEPKAGDRDRPFRGAGRRQEGAEESFQEKDGEESRQEAKSQEVARVIPGNASLRGPRIHNRCREYGFSDVQLHIRARAEPVIGPRVARTPLARPGMTVAHPALRALAADRWAFFVARRGCWPPGGRRPALCRCVCPSGFA